MNDRWVPEDILRHMQVGETEIYVLGCLERRRVTMGSQQMRAINLVHSICTRHYQNWKADKENSNKNYEWNPRVLVVGGSAGGLTAAAFAAYRGARVSLYERSARLMPHLRRSDRLLHPRLYEWGSPQPFVSDETIGYWSHDRVGLPLLDWSAGQARKIRRQLLKEWEGWQRLYKIDVRLNTALPDADDYGLWFQVPGSHSTRFDHVVLAVGFGSEAAIVRPDWANALMGSYWDPDTLDRTVGNIMICGNGDGALTDLFRASLKGFSQDKLAQLLPKLDPNRTLERRAMEIERRLEQSADEEVEFEMARAYLEMHAPALDWWTAENIRPDTSVVLSIRPRHGRRPESAFSKASFPLNRLLLASLLRVVNRQRLQVVYTTGKLPQIPPHAGTYALAFRAGIGEKPIDRLFSKKISAEGAKCYERSQLDRIAQISNDKSKGDITRRPAWAFFGEAVDPVSRPTAQAFIPETPHGPGHGEVYRRSLDQDDDAEALRVFQAVDRFSILSDAFDSVFQGVSDTAISAEDADAYFKGVLRLYLLTYDQVFLTDAQFWDGRFWARLPGVWSGIGAFEQQILTSKLTILNRRSNLPAEFQTGRHALFVGAKDGRWQPRSFDSSVLGPSLSAKYMSWVEVQTPQLPDHTAPSAEKVFDLFLESDLVDDEKQIVRRAQDQWRTLDAFLKMNPIRSRLWNEPRTSRYFRPRQQLENPGSFYANLSRDARRVLRKAFEKGAASTNRGELSQYLHQEFKNAEDVKSLYAEIGHIQDWFDRSYNRMSAKQQGANVFTSLHLGDTPGTLEETNVPIHEKSISLYSLGKLESAGFEAIVRKLEALKKKNKRNESVIRKPVTQRSWCVELDIIKDECKNLPLLQLQSNAGYPDSRFVRKILNCATIESFKMTWVGEQPGEGSTRLMTNEGPADDKGIRPDETWTEFAAETRV